MNDRNNMNSEPFDIQSLVRESGIPRRTIYFYVQQGLLPPPEGAGLAAHYGDSHLLRLRLIPILRGQGLRLDEIRRRFEQMTEAELRSLLTTTEAKRAAVEPRKEEPHAGMPVDWRRLPPSAPVAAEGYTHYRLPAGIVLVAPANLTGGDRQRLNLLLQAAGQIFTKSGPYFTHQKDGQPGLPDEE
jgi:DNA-binding transcriptional MerR regulator